VYWANDGVFQEKGQKSTGAVDCGWVDACGKSGKSNRSLNKENVRALVLEQGLQ
jgi:hypothetical protein